MKPIHNGSGAESKREQTATVTLHHTDTGLRRTNAIDRELYGIGGGKTSSSSPRVDLFFCYPETSSALALDHNF